MITVSTNNLFLLIQSSYRTDNLRKLMLNNFVNYHLNLAVSNIALTIHTSSFCNNKVLKVKRGYCYVVTS